jgi:hypothetical protein
MDTKDMYAIYDTEWKKEPLCYCTTKDLAETCAERFQDGRIDVIIVPPGKTLSEVEE